MTQKTITIYGNGKQVRDLLYVDDLINAYDKAAKHINVTKGQIYNIGGGSKNTISIWLEFKPLLEDLFNKKIRVDFSNWRPGDQPIFVSNIAKAKNDFGWFPKVGVQEGINRLFQWVKTHEQLF